MGIIRKNTFSYTILLKATSKNLRMLRFTVFTVLATVAMLTEAAPGGGYYYKKAKKPAPAPAPATRTAAPGNLVEVAQKLDGFKTLVGLVVELGLVETLSNVEAATVFAPTDDAFAKVAEVLPTLTTEQKTAIVARHVIAGKTVKAADVTTGSVGTFGGENIDLIKDDAGVGVKFNDGARSNVIIADVDASNGVIHAIDAVILPPAPATKTATVGDLVDVASGLDGFGILVGLVAELGLVDTLKNVEAATIFAPTDNAFKALPSGTLESLTTEQKTAIVARHVIAGATVKAADVTTGSVGTFGGENIDLVKDG